MLLNANVLEFIIEIIIIYKLSKKEQHESWAHCFFNGDDWRTFLHSFLPKLVFFLETLAARLELATKNISPFHRFLTRRHGWRKICVRWCDALIGRRNKAFENRTQMVSSAFSQDVYIVCVDFTVIAVEEVGGNKLGWREGDHIATIVVVVVKVPFVLPRHEVQRHHYKCRIYSNHR